MHNTERLTRGKPRHQLLMHPDDLAARGITDGNRVTVRSRVGSVVVEVQAAEDMMPGVVSLPHGYGHQVDGTGMSRAAMVPGVSINDLTDPERLDVSGNAALNGVPVTVTRTDLEALRASTTAVRAPWASVAESATSAASSQVPMLTLARRRRPDVPRPRPWRAT